MKIHINQLLLLMTIRGKDSSWHLKFTKHEIFVSSHLSKCWRQQWPNSFEIDTNWSICCTFVKFHKDSRQSYCILKGTGVGNDKAIFYLKTYGFLMAVKFINICLIPNFRIYSRSDANSLGLIISSCIDNLWFVQVKFVANQEEIIFIGCNQANTAYTLLNQRRI